MIFALARSTGQKVLGSTVDETRGGQYSRVGFTVIIYLPHHSPDPPEPPKHCLGKGIECPITGDGRLETLVRGRRRAVVEGFKEP
jgi:hypothetical protein